MLNANISDTVPGGHTVARMLLKYFSLVKRLNGASLNYLSRPIDALPPLSLFLCTRATRARSSIIFYIRRLFFAREKTFLAVTLAGATEAREIMENKHRKLSSAYVVKSRDREVNGALKINLKK